MERKRRQKYMGCAKWGRPEWVGLIYPNPSCGNSTIELVLNETSNISLQIFSSDGKLFMSKTFNQMPNGAYTFPLATDSWDNGVYLIKMNFGDQSITRRFVKF